MKNIKRLIAIVLTAAMLLCLVSCGGNEKGSTDTTSTSSNVSSEEVPSEYTPSGSSSKEEAKAQNAVVRYFKYAPGGKLKTTYDVDYSVEGTITVNTFDKNNYKTGSTVYDYDENGLVVYRSERDKDGNELCYTTYEFNNIGKIDTEYYYEEEALRRTSKYEYDNNGNLVRKKVETIGDNTVYTWDYIRDGSYLHTIYISTDFMQNVEGYTFTKNADGKLYQKTHAKNGYTADYSLYDYDKSGKMNYRGHFDPSNTLVEYYEFKYGSADDLAAEAFFNTGIMD